jgi:hypothetical protein
MRKLLLLQQQRKLTTRLAVTMPRMPYVRQGLFSPTNTVLLTWQMRNYSSDE